jgi:hypothetical protein
VGGWGGGAGTAGVAVSVAAAAAAAAVRYLFVVDASSEPRGNALSGLVGGTRQLVPSAADGKIKQRVAGPSSPAPAAVASRACVAQRDVALRLSAAAATTATPNGAPPPLSAAGYREPFG